MKILHTIPDFGAKSGGTSTCTYDLISALVKEGLTVDLLTTTPADTDDKLLGQGESWIKVVPNDYKLLPYAYSRNFKVFLSESEYDVYQANGLWMYADHITCQIARKKNKPYLITTHGMLYPAALHRSYWKKWPMLKLFFEKDVMNATCIHATCVPEMQHIRAFGYKGPIAVIPNPANLPDFIPEIKSAKQTFLGCSLPRMFGFLGRLHPRKKVEYLLYGINMLHSDNVELIIMGKGDADYETFLHSEVERLGLKNVIFKGFINGREKYEELAKLSCLFVPSDFENFGMIVTEALSVGTPVMASLGTPWEVLNTKRCGWWMDRTPENIASVMDKILSMTDDALLRMGEIGAHLVEEQFAADVVSKQMIKLYDWIIKGEQTPEFIYERD